MSYETMGVTVDADGIALVTIDIPGQSMNVWTATMIAEFAALVTRINGDDAIKGAVFTSGKASGFLAGADLRLLGSMKTATMGEAHAASFALSADMRRLETGGHAAQEIARGTAHPKPIACALNGLALGGGLELALACHYRVAADNPKLQLGLPEVTIGLLPGGGGTQRLLRLIGIAEAAKLLTTGAPVGPQQALALGLIDAVVPAEDVVAHAIAWVKANPQAGARWDKAGFKVPGGAGATERRFAEFFAGANAVAQARSQHNYRAVQAIMSCLYEGALLPLDRALRVESKYFTTLLMHPQSRSMIRTLFVNKQAAEKGAGRPAGVPPVELGTVAIIGGGLMGSGIAHVAAQARMQVLVLDRDLASAGKAADYSRRIVDKAVARGKLSQAAADQLLGRITPVDDYAAIAGADLVIEAVFEQPEVKADVIRRAEAVIGEQAILASNTSTLPITGLAAHCARPERFVGMHFFSPVERMPLLEIIPGEATGERALAAAFDFNARIRKIPILVRDVRGFYTNQVVPPYLNEAMLMVAEGVNPALVENAALALGMPIGPLALIDETTLVLGRDIQNAARQELGAAYQPAGTEELLETMVAIGRKGRRFGGGFYDYPADAPKQLWPGLAGHFPRLATQPGGEEVKRRLLFIQLIAAARCLADGIVSDPQSADLGAVFGWGFAAWTGGPMSHIDTLGIGTFVAQADELASRHGARFAPPPAFRARAAREEPLYALA